MHQLERLSKDLDTAAQHCCCLISTARVLLPFRDVGCEEAAVLRLSEHLVDHDVESRQVLEHLLGKKCNNVKEYIRRNDNNMSWFGQHSRMSKLKLDINSQTNLT